MENSLAKFMNQDLKGIISKISVVQGTAKDSGNIYFAIELEFINGYKKRLFLPDAEKFAWVNAIELLDTQKQINVSFGD